MAWTTPTDWAYKEAPGSSKMNTQVRDNLNYLKAMLPAGVMLPYGGSSAPTQWLLCDGSAVSRSTYADLYAAIGVAFGSGDGSSTFNLPDSRGRMFIGAGAGSGLTSRALAASGGAETKNISHTHTFSGNTGESPNKKDADGSGQQYTTSNHVHPFSGTTDSGGSATQDVMNPFLVATMIIKY